MIDEWRGLELQKYVLYELHVGTFTPEGTFDAIIPRIANLKQLGVTAIEIDAGRAISGRQELGLRRHVSICGAGFVWRASGTEATGERVPSTRNGRGAGRCL